MVRVLADAGSATRLNVQPGLPRTPWQWRSAMSSGLYGHKQRQPPSPSPAPLPHAAQSAVKRTCHCAATPAASDLQATEQTNGTVLIKDFKVAVYSAQA